ncbi:retrovirus-related pol polyprotein from transposon TNT 1-94 [Tanacetum coccineum]
MDAEQAFWLRISNPTSKPSDASPVKIEPPKELPKVSLVNESLKRLKFHLARFDNVVKIRTTPDARTECEWGFKHTKAVFNNEIIPFLKSLKDIFNVLDRDLLNEITKVQTVFNQLDAAVQQFSVDKQCLKIAKKELLLENDRLLEQIMSQEVLLNVMTSMSLIGESVNMDGKRKETCNLEAELLKSKNAFNDLLKSQLQDKDNTICKLKDMIKAMREKSKEEKSDSLIDKLNLKSIKNEDLKAQIQDKVFVITSLKNDLQKIKGKEIIDIATQIPSATTIVPSMFKLDLEPLAPRLLQNRNVHIKYYKYAQEKADILRGIVKQAKEKQPLDKELDFAFRFAEPLTSSSNSKQVESSKTSDSNKPVLSSTGLKCSTSKCGSKPTGNKRNDRILQTPSRNMKNKVEAQPRKVNKKNRVVEPICDDNVKHSMLNANYDLNCATCKKSLFDDVHDTCLLDFVKTINSLAKSTKKHKKQIPYLESTGHVFTEVGLKWKPTGKTFTIVGNLCPLTRITSTNVVQIVLWYLDSGCSKYMTWNHSQLMNFVSKFLGIVRFGNDHIARFMGYGDYQMGNVTILRLSHLNFGTINKLAKDDLAQGILRLKFQKDHLCFACELGKSKKSSHQPKAEDTNQEKLIFFIWICGARCVWRVLTRKVHLNATVRNVRTYNGTEFVNQTLREFYENVGISHQTSVARTPQQNGIVERRNRTLVEAARTMLIFSKAPLFLWAEAINTACYTQNRSIIRRRYNKTPYELMQDKKPDLSFFHVFGALCYPTNDNDDLGKLDAKADIGLVPNLVSQQPCILPPRDNWDHLFQPFFDEYFTPPPIAVTPFQEVAAPRVVVIADSLVSTSIDQDAPSSSTPST